MRRIFLTNGHFSKIDDSDYKLVNKYRWQESGKGYALTTKKFQGKLISMHRLIMAPPDDMAIDHINGDKLDNQRSNLRICTNEQNQRWCGPARNNKSGYVGVSWSNRDHVWIAQIRVNKKKKWLGCSTDIREAARLYNLAVKEIAGEFAFQNVIPNEEGLEKDD